MFADGIDCDSIQFYSILDLPQAETTVAALRKAEQLDDEDWARANRFFAVDTDPAISQDDDITTHKKVYDLYSFNLTLGIQQEQTEVSLKDLLLALGGYISDHASHHVTIQSPLLCFTPAPQSPTAEHLPADSTSTTVRGQAESDASTTENLPTDLTGTTQGPTNDSGLSHLSVIG